MTLIARLPLRPIRTDAELDAAAVVIDELTDRDDLSPSEFDYLDVLGDLVERYENEHVELPRVSDAAMLGFLMEEKGVRQADLVRGTGISKTVLSLVTERQAGLDARAHQGFIEVLWRGPRRVSRPRLMGSDVAVETVRRAGRLTKCRVILPSLARVAAGLALASHGPDR